MNSRFNISEVVNQKAPRLFFAGYIGDMRASVKYLMREEMKMFGEGL